MLSNNFILHLTLIEGITPSVIKAIMQSKRSGVQASDLYHLSSIDWMHYFGIPEKSAHVLVAGLSNMAVLEKELSLIEEYKIKWLTILDEAYPEILKEIYVPPFILYFYGDEQLFSSKSIAVVGSRKANSYGEKIVATIIPDLVAAGYTIISGGALGIDTMAHQAALESNGKTIAILGSGLLKPYPSSNKKLFSRIIEQGGIVASSYPVAMDPLPHHFPARNRIVTGLSKGCLVVQAAQKSGALISAHCALNQGREVFAVPGLFDDELSAGCHEIIQQGAKLVINSADILSEFGEKVPHVKAEEDKGLQQSISFGMAYLDRGDAPKIKKDYEQKFTESQQKIVDACKQLSSLQDIISTTALSFDVVQSELFNLQLDGIVSQDFTGMWVLNR